MFGILKHVPAVIGGVRKIAKVRKQLKEARELKSAVEYAIASTRNAMEDKKITDDEKLRLADAWVRVWIEGEDVADELRAVGRVLGF